MANSSSATFAILLLIAAAAITGPKAAYSLPFGGSILGCWEAISSFEGCVPKLITPAALNIQLILTPECCNAVAEIGENCFPTIYPSLFFSPKLGSFIQEICGDYSAPAPQPAVTA